MPNKRTTESDSLYNDIEKMSTAEILSNINQEDQKVAIAVKEAVPAIEKLVDSVSEKLQNGGRLFYIGAGTSGRLALVDASECPPTYGVPQDMVIGIIAGGQQAMFKAIENAEDDTTQAWKDLQAYKITSLDFVVALPPTLLKALKLVRQQAFLLAVLLVILTALFRNLPTSLLKLN
jgi:N-acetylmuramic acid 6-phosphate etherase